MKRVLIFCLTILIGFGLFARLWHFSQVPVSLYWDEVAIGLDARALLQTGQDLNNHSWSAAILCFLWRLQSPGLYLANYLFGKFLSVSELTVRLPSLLASFGITWLLFKWLGPFVATSFLIMPWSFHFSRIGFESHLSVFWLVLMIYLVIKKELFGPVWRQS